MRESVGSRRQRILHVVAQHRDVKVADLAALMRVSMVTIRRDLETLAQEGVVKRRHGVVTHIGSSFGSSLGPLPVDNRDPGTVAIIAPEGHSYLNAVTQGAREFLQQAGFRVVLHLSPNTTNPEQHLIDQLPRHATDGLLLAPRWRTRQQEESAPEFLERLDLPTVLVERRPSRGSSAVDSVRSDHWHGVRLAVEHLVTTGHRRILLAARQDSPTARTVTEAFEAITREHAQVEESFTVLSSAESAPDQEDTQSAIEALEPSRTALPNFANPGWLADLMDEHRFTAVLIHGDENALMLTQRLAASGAQVPQDYAVIAYDDVVAGLGSVPLTAVAPPRVEVGRTAAELLTQRIRVERHGVGWIPRRVELLPSLKIRSSS